jgi:hypothetical protein
MSDSSSRTSAIRFLASYRTWLLAAGIVIAAMLLYAPFLKNPLVFDDYNFFGRANAGEYLRASLSLSPRWVPYATFEWAGALFGESMPLHRLGNLALHALTAVGLFLFLRRLFAELMPAAVAGEGDKALPAVWLAFFAALIFALHPAAVYAAAYLIQRTILMATLFTLLTWYFFLEGVLRNRYSWLIASAAAYFCAVMSKEHAVMAPAVALALLVLVRPLNRETFKLVWPAFVLYIATAIYVVWLMKGGNVIARAYEPRGNDILARMALMDPQFNTSLAYPLSILTQGFLFFKYLLIWILPNPAWMSIDMFEDFATRFTSWRHVAGALAFVAYGAGAIYLLFRRGMKGLLGLALLCPWLMFATEFSTVRVQETFVIYRSYLWIPGLLAAVAVIFHKSMGRRAAVLLSVLILVMLPLSWSRLNTFSSPLALWEDAARLAEGKDKRPGVERVYHNRGLQLLKEGYADLALEDLNKAIGMVPNFMLALNDRGAAYLTLNRYQEALADFNRVILLDGSFSRAYLGRALAYEGMGMKQQAMMDYGTLCILGHSGGCSKVGLTTGR